MEIKILGSTSILGRALNHESIMDYAGRMAGICYMKGTLDDIYNEPQDKTIARATRTLNAPHHSVFGHTYVTLYLEGIPKILAMVLNNEKAYNTSEKSARYTEMKTEGLEQELYQKWIEIFEKEIAEKHSGMDGKLVKKYALENARYLISIFTPSTNMAYTVSIQQLNYIVGWMADFIECKYTEFDRRLADVFTEFINKMNKCLIVPGLKDPKGRKLSLFSTRRRTEEWGESYSTNYYGSFAQLAQAQRHRTLSYEFSFMTWEDLMSAGEEFYVPTILRDTTKLKEEWLKDAEKLEKNIPQGTKVNINERGTVENLILKCSERMCGQAQLEICTQTALTVSRYYAETNNDAVREELKPYVNLARCKSFGIECKNPCFFKPENIFCRLV